MVHDNAELPVLEWFRAHTENAFDFIWTMEYDVFLGSGNWGSVFGLFDDEGADIIASGGEAYTREAMKKSNGCGRAPTRTFLHRSMPHCQPPSCL
jgi:hypothetical protein